MALGGPIRLPARDAASVIETLAWQGAYAVRTRLLTGRRIIGRKALGTISVICTGAVVARRADRPRRVVAALPLLDTREVGRGLRPCQARVEMARATGACDPRATSAPFGLARARLSACPTPALIVLVQVPLTALARLAQEPSLAVIAVTLAGTPSLTRRPTSGGERVRPRPLSGIGGALGAIEGILLTSVIGPIMATWATRTPPKRIGRRALQGELIPAAKPTLEAITTLAVVLVTP